MKKVNSDVAYEHIRKKILSGEYPLGYPLLTEALSAETKVSRTPVREALHKLKAEGLVTLSPRLGASVKTMDVKEFQEMCELRLALEGHAAGLAAKNHSQADLQEIKLALDGMRELTEKILGAADEAPFLEDLRRADVRFHIGIMTAAKNELMKREILRLHLVNRIVVGPINLSPPNSTKDELDTNRSDVLASHQEIYDAIVAHDDPLAKQAMERHIQDIISKSLRQLTGAGKLAPRHLTEDELAYSG